MSEPSVRWRDDHGDVSGVIAGESHVYATTDRGVIAYDPAEGDVVWEAATDADDAPAVAYGRGQVLCSADTDDGRHASVLGLYTDDGTKRWETTIEGTLTTNEVVFLDPTAAGASAGDRAGAVSAVVFDADAGRSIRTFAVASGERLSSVPLSETTKVRMTGETLRGTAGDLVFAAPDSDEMVAVDVADGSIAWRYDGSPGGDPPFAAALTRESDGDRVFVGSETGLDVLRRSTGETVTSRPDGPRRPATRVAEGADAVYVAMAGRNRDGPEDPARLTAYSAHGNQRWEATFRPTESLRALAVEDDETVLLQTRDADADRTILRAVDGASGETRSTVTNADRAALVSRFDHDSSRRRPSDDIRLLTESHGGLVAFDDEEVWRATGDPWEGIHRQKLATHDGLAYVVSDDGVLHALERPGLTSRLTDRFR